MKAFLSVIVTTAALLLTGCDVPEPRQKSPHIPERNLASEAYGVGRRACELALKAPSTAKFSQPGHEPHGYQQWKVWGEVDSQNNFGAMLRSPWVAVVRLRAEKWSVEYLRVGDVEIGTLPVVALAPVPQPTSEQIAARSSVATEKFAKVRAAELQHHQDLAAKGDRYGLYRMGKRYLEGDGVSKDEAKGLKLLDLAALAGSDDAKALLATLK